MARAHNVYLSGAAVAAADELGLDGVVENMVEKAIAAGMKKGMRVHLPGGYIARTVPIGTTAGGRRKLLVTGIFED